jgi:hypothetical protein
MTGKWRTRFFKVHNFCVNALLDCGEARGMWTLLEFFGCVIGGAKRDRTADLLVANEALSQLSYSPTRWE